MDSNIPVELDPVEAKRQEMAARLQRERDREADEREAHREAIAVEAEVKGSELETLLEQLAKPDRVRVRLEAAILARAEHGQYSNQRQSRTDDIALELARYVITGKV